MNNESYIDSSSVGLAAVLFVLIVGLWIYMYAMSKQPEFNRRGHPVHVPSYFSLPIDFNPFMLNDVPIKNDVFDVYDPTTFKLGDTSVYIGYFEMGKVKMVKKLPIEVLLIHRHTDVTNNLRLQYISHLYDDSTEIAKYFAENVLKMLKNVKTKYKIHSNEIEDVSVDIHTNPWIFGARFNCVDRWSTVLYGTKRLLIFNVKSGTDYVKYVLDNLSNKRLDDAQDFLETIGIKTQLVSVHNGDLLYIPGGTFFMEDSDLSKEHTITLNLDVALPILEQKECVARFNTLWDRPFEKLELYR